VSVPTRILFVEDDKATREGYAAYLRGHGYDVIASPSGLEALNFAFNWLPSVIVLDLGLKDVDGWEMFRSLRSPEPTSRLRASARCAPGAIAS